MFATKKVLSSTTLRLAALASALAVVVPLTPAPAHAYACGRVSGCTSFELVSAGASYNWYPVAVRYEFKGGRTAPRQWKLSGAGKQYQQNGMLTLVAAAGRHTTPLASTWSDVHHTKGRWESRMRTKQYGGGSAYRVQLALIPAKRSERHCGAQDITFLDYTPAKRSTAKVAANTLPAASYTYSKKLSRKVGGDEWHVFGVEVTAKHIAWFMDAHLVAIEKRPAALSGVDLKMQARLVPTAGKRMEKTRLQLDWARYWTMKKKGKTLGKAARPVRAINKAAC
ncbi:hypothetical protein [Nocardioides sp.]|uniref:hypothetical protein n=1 Tax=Nocardioides sp. TaxID=35761 RepID=UPI0026116CFA|nr:hypothetical protein [Nocardioides sp.]